MENNNQNENQEQELDLNQLLQIRRDKICKIRIFAECENDISNTKFY